MNPESKVFSKFIKTYRKTTFFRLQKVYKKLFIHSTTTKNLPLYITQKLFLAYFKTFSQHDSIFVEVRNEKEIPAQSSKIIQKSTMNNQFTTFWVAFNPHINASCEANRTIKQFQCYTVLGASYLRIICLNKVLFVGLGHFRLFVQ